jgi:5-bromo-4-chloroindolyl phosphate hydrolysis protein
VDAYFYTGPSKDMAYKHELEIIQDLNKTDKKILELMRVLEKNSRAIVTLDAELKNFQMNVSKDEKIDS